MKDIIMRHAIIRLEQLSANQLAPLQNAAQSEGYTFIDRLAEEYASGVNRFEQPGEALFGVFDEQHLIGIGGLNIDPYHPGASYGRVRHIYVLPNYRRQGIARQLVSAIIAAAHGAFAPLTLYTSNAHAAQLYEQLGFVSIVDDPTTTHILFAC
jgi:GNAT superfamily N-acetyltransferase